jgi:hypothetical protein
MILDHAQMRKELIKIEHGKWLGLFDNSIPLRDKRNHNYSVWRWNQLFGWAHEKHRQHFKNLSNLLVRFPVKIYPSSSYIQITRAGLSKTAANNHSFLNHNLVARKEVKNETLYLEFLHHNHLVIVLKYIGLMNYKHSIGGRWQERKI